MPIEPRSPVQVAAARVQAWQAWRDRQLAPRTPPPCDVSVVVPTRGGAGLDRLLQSLADSCAGAVPEVVVVDDRPAEDASPWGLQVPARVVRSEDRGRAAARNLGLRTATTEWVVLLDDDLVVGPSWFRELRDDLGAAGRAVAGVAARASGSQEPARLGADVAYRRLVALSLGGFQTRFPRAACHDDVELAQRLVRRGWVISTGMRGCATVPSTDADRRDGEEPDPSAAQPLTASDDGQSQDSVRCTCALGGDPPC